MSVNSFLNPFSSVKFGDRRKLNPVVRPCRGMRLPGKPLVGSSNRFQWTETAGLCLHGVASVPLLFLKHRISCPVGSQNLRGGSALREVHTGVLSSSLSPCTASAHMAPSSCPWRPSSSLGGLLRPDHSHLRPPAGPRPARWARGRGAGAR